MDQGRCDCRDLILTVMHRASECLRLDRETIRLNAAPVSKRSATAFMHSACRCPSRTISSTVCPVICTPGKKRIGIAFLTGELIVSWIHCVILIFMMYTSWHILLFTKL